jgi:hypothetical protein
MRAAREGEQEGAETKTFQPRTPSFAMRSKVGVETMSLTEGISGCE